MGLGPLIRVEWVKTMRMRSTYIAFVAAGLLIFLIQIGIYVGADDSNFYQFLKKFGYDTSLLMNGFVATRVAMEVGFALLVAPMTIMTFARQIAGEDLRGTLRLILARPISRPSLMTSKFLVCSMGSFLLMGFFLSLSYSVGLALYGPHDSITVGKLSELDRRNYAADEEQTRKDFSHDSYRRADEEKKKQLGTQWRVMGRSRNEAIAQFIITPRQCLFRLVIAWLFTSWALLSIGSMALFYSTINKHPIAAMALTIGTYFMFMILQGLASQQNIIPIFKWLEPYLLTTAMDFWRGCFSVEIDWRDSARQASLLGAYTVGFYALAQFIFWRRDITS